MSTPQLRWSPTRQSDLVGLPPDVSVCIVNWNCREYLRALLQSLLLHEQAATFEIIVVDNASRDGAADMVADDFPEVRLVRNPVNVGFARANNQAAALATGRYLFFLNNDTLVPPDTLGPLMEYAQRHPEVAVVAPRLRDGRGRIQRSCRCRPSLAALLHRTLMFRWTGLFRRAYRRYRWRCEQLDEVRSVEVVMGAALLLRRELFTQVQGWDEDFAFGGEDIDFCTRVKEHGEVVYFPETEVVHFGRVSSRLHAGYAHSNTLIGITRFLRKHGTPAWQLLFYKLVLTLDVPLQWLSQAVQYAWRRVRRRPRSAARSLLALRGLSHFLRTGLWQFWQV